MDERHHVFSIATSVKTFDYPQEFHSLTAFQGNAVLLPIAMIVRTVALALGV
jgi:hypothetical protein